MARLLVLAPAPAGTALTPLSSEFVSWTRRGGALPASKLLSPAEAARPVAAAALDPAAAPPLERSGGPLAPWARGPCDAWYAWVHLMGLLLPKGESVAHTPQRWAPPAGCESRAPAGWPLSE